ncbi:MAG: agglutinin biogenesis protein MshI [Sideroxydans sp.]|nr:agglutinin biogenesis protein MshI [Sideroxydans sp.]
MQMPTLSSLFSRSSRDAGWFAICVNQAGVYLTEIQRMGGRLHVTACAFHPATDVTAATLEKICKEAHLGNHQFTTLLAPGEYQILMVDAPNVPVDELKTAIRWRIKDALSYHIDDATVDVLQIPSGKYGAERPQSMYAVAASNVTIQKRIALFDKANIQLNVIDIPEMAQRNIAALFETEGRALAVLAFDDEGGLLTFTSGGELYLARRIDITVGQLLDANQTLCQQYQDRVELEVQRSLDYFGRQYHYIPVGRLLVSVPEASNLTGVLAEHLDMPVERLNLTQVMDVSAVPELESGDYAVHALHALGAALRQERRAL